MPRLSLRAGDRVAQRPDPRSWAPDELMRLEEAVRLFWPHGPLTAKSLRTAVRDGRLAIAVIAGKHFTCRQAIDWRDAEAWMRGDDPTALLEPPPDDASRE